MNAIDIGQATLAAQVEVNNLDYSEQAPILGWISESTTPIKLQYQALDQAFKRPEILLAGLNRADIDKQVNYHQLKRMFAEARQLINSLGEKDPELVAKLTDLFVDHLLKSQITPEAVGISAV